MVKKILDSGKGRDGGGRKKGGMEQTLKGEPVLEGMETITGDVTRLGGLGC